MINFSETIEVCDVEVGMYSKLNKCMYLRSRSFVDPEVNVIH